MVLQVIRQIAPYQTLATFFSNVIHRNQWITSKAQSAPTTVVMTTFTWENLQAIKDFGVDIGFFETGSNLTGDY